MRLTDAEWQVMNALWQESPATTRDVLSRLPKDVSWAYTTVKTMLARLEAKAVVSASKRGKTTHYTPILTRAKARRSALASLIDRAFEGAMGPLIHCLVGDGKLTGKDREELARLLAEQTGESDDDSES
jgi:BlaI family transcriptional regulator, penicillinase repressor